MYRLEGRERSAATRHREGGQHGEHAPKGAGGLVPMEMAALKGETAMPVYLVECDLPGVTLAGLAALRHAARETCERFAQDGQPVRYLRSIFVPGESRCLCLFEAPNADRVHEVNEAAQIPYSRIVLALDLAPP